MREKTYERRMAEYLNGEMSPRAEAAFKKALAAAGRDPGRPAEYASLLRDVERLDCPQPSASMRRKFDALLVEAKRDAARAGSRSSSGAGPVFFRRPAPAVGLLFLGGLIGFWLSPILTQNNQVTELRDEVREMKKSVVLMMLDEPSAAQRMKAVKISRDIRPVDDRIIDALLATLNKDPNVNVRLVAVETLAGFADSQRARAGLIEAMAGQDSAAIQLALADLMLAWREKKAVAQFEKLLGKNDLDGGLKLRFNEIRNRLL
jgi:hypothetical protein